MAQDQLITAADFNTQPMPPQAQSGARVAANAAPQLITDDDFQKPESLGSKIESFLKGAAVEPFQDMADMLNPALNASGDLLMRLGLTSQNEAPQIHLQKSLGIARTPSEQAGEKAVDLGSLAVPAFDLARLGYGASVRGINKGSQKLLDYLDKPAKLANEAKKMTDNTAQELRQSVIPTQFRNHLNSVTEGVGNVPEYFATSHDAYKNIANQLYNAKNAHDLRVPNFLGYGEGAQDAAALLNKNRKVPLSNFQIERIKKSNPELIQSLQKQEQDKKNSLESWLSKDENDLAAKHAKKEYKLAAKQPNIANLHELQKELGTAASASDSYPERKALWDLSQKVKNEGVINPLNEMDVQYGTKTALPYKQADQWWKQNVLPFRATKFLEEMANGKHSDAPISQVVSEIKKGKSNLQKFSVDPETGRKLGQIPDGHILNIKLPELEQLAQYQSSNPLKNLVAGRTKGDLPSLQSLYEKEYQNGSLSDNHPLMFHKPGIDSGVNTLDLANQAAENSKRSITKALLKNAIEHKMKASLGALGGTYLLHHLF